MSSSSSDDPPRVLAINVVPLEDAGLLTQPCRWDSLLGTWVFNEVSKEYPVCLVQDVILEVGAVLLCGGMVLPMSMIQEIPDMWHIAGVLGIRTWIHVNPPHVMRLAFLVLVMKWLLMHAVFGILGHCPEIWMNSIDTIQADLTMYHLCLALHSGCEKQLVHASLSFLTLEGWPGFHISCEPSFIFYCVVIQKMEFLQRMHWAELVLWNNSNSMHTLTLTNGLTLVCFCLDLIVNQWLML